MRNLIILLSLFFSYTTSNAEILPGRSIDYCVKIQNADSFPGVKFVLVVKPVDNSIVLVTEIKSSSCIDKGYKFNTSDVYAINSNYNGSKDIKTIDYKNDKNVYISNISLPAVSSQIITDNYSINRIEEFYRILGFRDGFVILYLHKRITKYSDNQDDLIETFTTPELASIRRNIKPAGIFSSEISADLLLYPTPTQEYLNIYMLNQCYGNVSIDIFNLAGQKLCSNHFEKNKEELKRTINIKALANGVYNLKFTIGNVSVNKLFLKKIITGKSSLWYSNAGIIK